ncbi:hypothetical protein ACFVIM_08485 [Streptomyces sp. NPDC057638]|uniref:hypothetical protein n=1 Tax=Streptomyces sp. NPDC057638 TaxID=3346190 RepID=UPI0036B8A1BC
MESKREPGTASTPVTPPSAYQPPAVLDAGTVVGVTLGKNTFDRVDNSQYKDK